MSRSNNTTTPPVSRAGLATIVCLHVALPSKEPVELGVIDSAQAPGVGHSLVTIDPRAAAYYNNAEAVNTGKRLFSQYNCSGCHSSGGGGMGPDLMDDVWIYGSRLEQIHQTLVDGRPNGMPAWGGKVPDEELWDLAAYVRSLSLPEWHGSFQPRSAACRRLSQRMQVIGCVAASPVAV